MPTRRGRDSPRRELAQRPSPYSVPTRGLASARARHLANQPHGLQRAFLQSDVQPRLYSLILTHLDDL